MEEFYFGAVDPKSYVSKQEHLDNSDSITLFNEKEEMMLYKILHLFTCDIVPIEFPKRFSRNLFN